jgi:hypothetical protein
MAGRPLSLVLQHVRGLAAAPDTTDAELLGRIAAGTVSGRLDWARKLLRRLERRGVSVSAGALAVVLAEQAAPAAPPAALAEAARRAGMSLAAVTPGVASLAEGAMPSLLAARVKLTAALLLLAGALAAPYLPASPPQEGPEVAQAAPGAAPAAPQPEEADEDAEPGLKDRAVARLEAVAPQRWVASWQANLDVNEQPAGPALGRLARELGLTVEATPAQRRALERPITLSLRGRSRLELVEEVCRRVDLYPVYPDNVTRTDLP